MKRKVPSLSNGSRHEAPQAGRRLSSREQVMWGPSREAIDLWLWIDCPIIRPSP